MITLRKALPSDQKILEHWDQQAHVIAASGEDDEWDWAYELPREVAWREMFIAEKDHRSIGIIQIIDPKEEETHYWGEIEAHKRALDIWIGEASDLGKGYGTLMMQKALIHCFANPKVTAVLIDPLRRNVRAIRFYERLGFQFLENRTFGEDACVVLQITRAGFEMASGVNRK